MLLMMTLKICLKYNTRSLSGFVSLVLNAGIRPLFVWFTGIIFFYCFNLTSFGEPWVVPYSPLNFLGFVLFLSGTTIYNFQAASASPTQDMEEVPHREDVNAGDLRLTSS